MVGVADKGKKQKVEEDSDFNEDVILAAVEKLQDFQHRLSKINEQASDEVLAIEQKYSTIRKPVYEKRNEAINTIPDFWLTAFMSHPVLGDLLTDEDQKIFRHLSALEVDDCTDVKSGYSISFVFKPNPYFEDAKLTKTFTFHDEGTAKVTATKIKWKEGMAIPNGEADERKGNKRPAADDSFFTWFSGAEFKCDDEFQDEVADIIKDELWSDPLVFFNNEVAEEASDGDEEIEIESDSEEEDDGEEDE